MSIIINHGSGPVPETSPVLAEEAMKVFVQDLEAKHPESSFAFRTPGVDQGDGRWEFQVVRVIEGKVVSETPVEMPGLAIDAVRYMGDDTQNIWDFPRLYIDGSSWLWMFALMQWDGDEE